MTRRGVIVTLVMGVIVTAALLVTSLSAPVELVSRPLNTQQTPMPSLAPLTRPTRPAATLPPAGEAAGGSWISTLFGVLLVLLAVAVLALLVAMVVAAFRRFVHRPVVTAHREPRFDAPLVPDDLLESAAGRLALLETGEPRNAIVAAWLDLERAAGETGLPRQRAETSTEYTSRVLGAWPVDGQRLGDLAGLYREARFSVHALDETHRRRAIDDLQVLHHDLEQIAREQRAAQSGPPADGGPS